MKNHRVRHTICALLLVILLFGFGSALGGPQSGQQTGNQTKADASAQKKTPDATKQDQQKTPPATTAPSNATSGAPNSKSTATQKPAPPANSSGTVWVNTDSKIYHKPGTRWYGKTKHGKYMTEADAIKARYHAAAKE